MAFSTFCSISFSDFQNDFLFLGLCNMADSAFCFFLLMVGWRRRDTCFGLGAGVVVVGLDADALAAATFDRVHL
jgi:hypothetical protein